MGLEFSGSSFLQSQWKFVIEQHTKLESMWWWQQQQQQVNNHHYINDIGGEPKQTKPQRNKHTEYPKWFSQSTVG